MGIETKGRCYCAGELQLGLPCPSVSWLLVQVRCVRERHDKNGYSVEKHKQFVFGVAGAVDVVAQFLLGGPALEAAEVNLERGSC